MNKTDADEVAGLIRLGVQPDHVTRAIDYAIGAVQQDPASGSCVKVVEGIFAVLIRESPRPELLDIDARASEFAGAYRRMSSAHRHEFGFADISPLDWASMSDYARRAVRVERLEQFKERLIAAWPAAEKEGNEE